MYSKRHDTLPTERFHPPTYRSLSDKQDWNQSYTPIVPTASAGVHWFNSICWSLSRMLKIRSYCKMLATLKRLEFLMPWALEYFIKFG